MLKFGRQQKGLHFDLVHSNTFTQTISLVTDQDQTLKKCVTSKIIIKFLRNKESSKNPLRRISIETENIVSDYGRHREVQKIRREFVNQKKILYIPIFLFYSMLQHETNQSQSS